MGTDKKPLKVAFDQGEFETLEGVPVFDEHDGDVENLDIDFTPEVLQQIIDACNKRIEDTGDRVPVTDRHTSDDPSGPEPDVLGFASNFRLGDLGKVSPRKAIYCDMHIFKNKMDKAKSLPRRSIELWPDMVADPVVMMPEKNPIDSVALLGAQRPARDLGLLFHKKQNTPARYRRVMFDGEKENMDPEAIIKQCLEAFTNTPVHKWAEQQMQKEQAEAANKEQFDHIGFDELVKKLVGEGHDEESAKKIAAKIGDEKYGVKGMEEKSEKARESKTKYGESDAEEAKKEEELNDHEREKEDEDEDKLEPAKLRMQRDQERRKYAKLEANYKALFAKVEALERDKRVANRKADLMDLEGQGYAFDLADELEYVSDMEPKLYSKHLNKIKKNYAKAPIGVSIKPAPVKAEGGVAPAIQNPSDVYAKLSGQYKPTKVIEKKPE